MGMNIYTMDGKHIGKRSADGVWCWTCKTRVDSDIEDGVFTCSICGAYVVTEDLVFNPAFRELGLDKYKSKKHVGVDGASSFCWCVGSNGLGETIAEVKVSLRKRKKVKTEYGDVWNIKQFWDMFKDVIRERSIEGDFS